jgi:hypothetical protein
MELEVRLLKGRNSYTAPTKEERKKFKEDWF